MASHITKKKEMQDTEAKAYLTPSCFKATESVTETLLQILLSLLFRKTGELFTEPELSKLKQELALTIQNVKSLESSELTEDVLGLQSMVDEMQRKNYALQEALNQERKANGEIKKCLQNTLKENGELKIRMAALQCECLQLREECFIASKNSLIRSTNNFRNMQCFEVPSSISRSHLVSKDTARRCSSLPKDVVIDSPISDDDPHESQSEHSCISEKFF